MSAIRMKVVFPVTLLNYVIRDREEIRVFVGSELRSRVIVDGGDGTARGLIPKIQAEFEKNLPPMRTNYEWRDGKLIMLATRTTEDELAQKFPDQDLSAVGSYVARETMRNGEVGTWLTFIRRKGTFRNGKITWLPFRRPELNWESRDEVYVEVGGVRYEVKWRADI